MTVAGYAIVSGILGAHTGAIIALAVVLGRTREKLVRVEEWVRLREQEPIVLYDAEGAAWMAKRR